MDQDYSASEMQISKADYKEMEKIPPKPVKLSDRILKEKT